LVVDENAFLAKVRLPYSMANDVITIHLYTLLMLCMIYHSNIRERLFNDWYFIQFRDL